MATEKWLMGNKKFLLANKQTNAGNWLMANKKFMLAGNWQVVDGKFSIVSGAWQLTNTDGKYKINNGK
jgi:hypothetical protein